MLLEIFDVCGEPKDGKERKDMRSNLSKNVGGLIFPILWSAVKFRVPKWRLAATVSVSLLITL